MCDVDETAVESRLFCDACSERCGVFLKFREGSSSEEYGMFDKVLSRPIK